MGSGTGKARRGRSDRARLEGRSDGVGLGAQRTIITASGGVKVDQQRWVDFVRNHQLEKMRLYEYYLGRKPTQITEVEHDKVIHELFADMIAVGSVTFSPAELKEEVQLKFRARQYSQSVEVKLKSKPAAKPLSPDFYYLDEKTTMLGRHLVDFQYRLVREIGELLRAAV